MERRWLRRHPGRPAPLGHGPSSLRHPPSVVECTAQQHLDLRIEAAELICRPAGQGIVDSGIDPKEYLLAITHGSRVEHASVHDWRSRLGDLPDDDRGDLQGIAVGVASMTSSEQ